MDNKEAFLIKCKRVNLMKEIKNKNDLNILLNKVDLFVNNESSNILARLDASKSSSYKFFENYEYPICSYPVIIDDKISKELNELAIIIPKLIYQIPKLYFNNNKKQLADFYFRGNQMLIEFAMMLHEKNIEIPCRLDLTKTNEGFKILEANFGSSIGGWQINSFEEGIRKLHKPLAPNNISNQFKTINTQTIYIEFIVTKILDTISLEDNTINVFIGLDFENKTKKKEESLEFFNTLFQQELNKRNLNGGAYSGSLSSIKQINKNLFFENTKIQCVLLVNKTSEKAPADIFRAILMDKIYSPDHLGVSMLGDKRNLGLLRELALQNKFKKEENELVLKSIPWSNTVSDCNVLYNSNQESLLELLRENKDNFVIKPSNGAQGRDVFIGKFLSSENWNEIVQTASTKGGFIAQTFCDSIHYSAPDKSNQWRPHKLVWGAFGFGDTYGGVWVRMSEVKSGKNVINSANGAVEAIVFETDSEIN